MRAMDTESPIRPLVGFLTAVTFVGGMAMYAFGQVRLGDWLVAGTIAFLVGALYAFRDAGRM